ncbi:BamA/TamA family outer membrane protein [Roseivirga sp.]|uniref:BamA/TamA family outer membrane protein n=1 Tax=Roseivirga sp. TaxID=1964215 RepID=UPI002B275394|nr:BamA/TamA family outer membrane protein [Roseivirga sp.]
MIGITLKKSLKGIVILTSVCILSLKSFGQNTSVSDSLNSDPIKIGKTYITGNKKTKAEIILRELDFIEGDQFDIQEFNQSIVLSQQKLINTRLFITVEVVPLFTSDTEVDILIRLQERWYIFPLPIFKLADRNFTEWWVNQKRDFSRVNYGVQLYHFNLTGRNDKLIFRTQFGFTKQYELLYQRPYINKAQTLGLTLRTSFANNKTVATNTDGHRLQFEQSDDINRRIFSSSGTLTYRPSFYSRHSVDAGFSRASVSELITDANSEYFQNGEALQKYFRLSYVYSWDNRDYFAYPLSGNLFRGEVSNYGMGIFNDLNMFSLRGSTSNFFDLGGKLYLANSLEGYYNFSDEIPYMLRSGFGYRPDFIRGYERYVVESNAFISNRSELKYKFLSGIQELSRRSLIDQFRTMPYAFYFKAFVDMGYTGDPIRSTTNNFYNRELMLSAGLGLDIVTYYDFVVRFEFSVNRQKQTGFFVNFRSAL